MPAEPNTGKPITPEQLRAARKLLSWSMYRLALASNTTAGFITNYEKSGRVSKFQWRPRDFDGLASIRNALEKVDVEFTDGDEPGVKLRRAEK